jgi:hypothetical protein
MFSTPSSSDRSEGTENNVDTSITNPPIISTTAEHDLGTTGTVTEDAAAEENRNPFIAMQQEAAGNDDVDRKPIIAAGAMDVNPQSGGIAARTRNKIHQ